MGTENINTLPPLDNQKTKEPPDVKSQPNKMAHVSKTMGILLLATSFPTNLKQPSRGGEAVLIIISTIRQYHKLINSCQEVIDIQILEACLPL